MTKTIKQENQYKKGLWTSEEDKILIDHVKLHGKGQWGRIAKKTGLNRCGKSCRLRWMNYLCPSVKLGNFTEDEEDLIIRLHKLLGNRWSLIAKRVPGRTDNQVKNYWNTHLSKKLVNKEETSRVDDTGNHSDSKVVKVVLFEALTSSHSSLFCHIITNAVTDECKAYKVVGEVSDKQGSEIEDDNLSSFWISDNYIELSIHDGFFG